MATHSNWYIIVNPASGNGAGKRSWPKIKALLEKHLFDFEFIFTEHEQHSIILIENAVNQGFRRFICVGGDGTIHNAINGIMKQQVCVSSEINLGVIPVGTGNDWIKTQGISKQAEKAIQTIKAGNIQKQDIGRIDFTFEDKPSVYFNNLLGIGFDAEVVRRVESIKGFGAAAYIIGALLSLFNIRKFKTIIRYSEHELTANALMVLVGLCQYSGGGMQLTHTPDCRDGSFDISVANNFGRFDIIKNIVKLFNGKITQDKKVMCFKSDKVSIEVQNEVQPYIQADGELIGKGSFSTVVLSKALSFYA